MIYEHALHHALNVIAGFREWDAFDPVDRVYLWRTRIAIRFDLTFAGSDGAWPQKRPIARAQAPSFKPVVLVTWWERREDRSGETIS